jgi:hypothetical protein
LIPKDPELKEILSKKGLDGIVYKDGIPDFSKIAVDKVTITQKYLKDLANPTEDQVRYYMRKEAKEILAEKMGIEDIGKWLKDNVYTIHEEIDMKTLTVVPTKVNEYFKHYGGVAAYMEKMK